MAQLKRDLLRSEQLRKSVYRRSFGVKNLIFSSYFIYCVVEKIFNDAA